MTHGLLLVNKPHALTSHDVVARMRRVLQTRAIGHAGTLDPMATGLLILCVGNATRLSEFVLGQDKTYEATIKLGERTNTDDADGMVVETRAVHVTAYDIERIRLEFVGEIEQVPPQFSAIQKNGVRAYALARKGETVELAPRRVTIHRMTLTPSNDDDVHANQKSEIAHPKLSLRITCSSGTYIRSLARDMGERLGCGGHLVALRRTSIGAFHVNNAHTLDALMKDWAFAKVALLPMDMAVQALTRIALDAENTKRFAHGQMIELDARHDADARCRVYDAGDTFMGIGELDATGARLHPIKVLHT